MVRVEEEDLAQTARSIAWKLIPPFRRLEPTRVKPNSSSIQPKSARWPALLTASAFNRLGQHARSSSDRAYCYTELTVSSLVVAVSIASMPTHGGMARLS